VLIDDGQFSLLSVNFEGQDTANLFPDVIMIQQAGDHLKYFGDISPGIAVPSDSIVEGRT